MEPFSDFGSRTCMTKKQIMKLERKFGRFSFHEEKPWDTTPGSKALVFRAKIGYMRWEAVYFMQNGRLTQITYISVGYKAEGDALSIEDSRYVQMRIDFIKIYGKEAYGKPPWDRDIEQHAPWDPCLRRHAMWKFSDWHMKHNLYITEEGRVKHEILVLYYRRCNQQEKVRYGSPRIKKRNIL
jgi:hypothetical protein